MRLPARVRSNPIKTWVASAIGILAVLAAGVLVVPSIVWNRFLWHYFWGPVYADAHNAQCAVLESGGPRLLFDQVACGAAVREGAIVAEPGYTVVSEIGYAATLVFLLIGVYYLGRELGIGSDRQVFFALIPFMLFGGALRVVEDAGDAAVAAGVEPAIGYPLNTLFISPLIYLTMFVSTVAALLLSIGLDRRGIVETYARPLAGIGIIAVLVVSAYLLALAVRTTYVGFYPQMTVATLGGATIIAGGVWYGLNRYLPTVTAGVESIGLVVVWGHAVDGVANYLAADWTTALGLPIAYGAKHPVNRYLNDLVGNVAPLSIQRVIGVAWGFLLVKIVAAVLVVYIFDERIFEESPRYALLLLVAILAVGLGPGTRDMLRATFGI